MEAENGGRTPTVARFINLDRISSHDLLWPLGLSLDLLWTGPSVPSARGQTIGDWRTDCLAFGAECRMRHTSQRRGSPDLPAAHGKTGITGTGGNDMHETHRRAAEQHELAAQAHRTAAEHNEKGENEAGNWHSERALEYSEHAFRLAQEAHNKSGQIGSL